MQYKVSFNNFGKTGVLVNIHDENNQLLHQFVDVTPHLAKLAAEYWIEMDDRKRKTNET